MSTAAGAGPLNVVDYSPGVCNIGPAEIARRRLAGHVGLVVCVVGFVLLAATAAPHWTRLILFLPAAASASGYLQAWLHFCAGFGSRGVYNFGPLGKVQQVADRQARARDRARSLRIGVAAGLIGVAVAIVAVLLPV
ncbi:MAG: hypothetical protein ABSA21_07640 [Candidatus Limnocylindrales bacterium]|jgi:hypothetical protein